MDLELRNITRRMATGDISAISDFITHYYRQEKCPQRVFNELREYIGADDAEVALIAYHDAIRDDLFTLLKSRNAKAVRGLTNIFSERGWFRHGLAPHLNTKLVETFPETSYGIRVTEICNNCRGTGIPHLCEICAVEYPCNHFNTIVPDGMVLVQAPQQSRYGGIVSIRCPYCDDTHDHQFNYDIDNAYRMAPRQSNCAPGGEYVIQFLPNCSCEKNNGTVIAKIFRVFEGTFYRHVWANLHPPNIEIDTFISGKNYCNILLEDDPKYKHPTINGWVLVKDRPHDRNLTIKYPVARLDLEGTADLVYWDLIRAHRGLPQPGTE